MKKREEYEARPQKEASSCGRNLFEETKHERDFAGYHVSFGQTVFGRKYVDFTENELAALLYIYGPMFVGVE